MIGLGAHQISVQGAQPTATNEAPPDYRYKIEVLARDLTRPMLLHLAPDGRLFFNELGGKLRIWKPSGEVVESGSVPVFEEQENGFLGFALDPQFAKNNWIYLLYSPTNFVGQQLSRFQMDGDRLDLASEKEMFRFVEQRRECCHHAGSVRFAPDGCLLISTGDNTHPFGDSESYGPMDERPDREPWDAQRTSGNTASQNGKILRIRPTPEGGYTIPDGNLFPKDGSGGCPEIYVMGCRNPWRMSVDEKTGIVYWGDVGPDAGGDGPRGSRGYDEINQARRAGNYGWPYFVGSNAPYAKVDYQTKAVGPMFDPARPVNNSVNNTGAKVLPPAQPALIYWPYGNSQEFPMLGSGGRTACAGPVFHFKTEFEKTGGFPEHFDHCLLFWDWQRPFMKWARLDEDSRLVGIEAFTGAVTLANAKQKIEEAEKAGTFVIRRPIDAQFGRDGCLYVLDYGETWGTNTDSKLIRISYQRGNLAPIARAAASPAAGREPLTVSLSSTGSKDIEGDSLRFEWRLFEGASASPTNTGAAAIGKLLSTEPDPGVTVDKPGNYIVQLTVIDDKGANSKTTLPLVVGNTPPQVRFESPQEGDFFTLGKPISYQVRAVDAEDGDSAHFEELMDARTFVSAQSSRGDGKEEDAGHPGLALMKQSDCFNCHAIETKIVGPAYLEVANKYRGQPGALEASVQRVIKGSSGVWSELPMLPHESFTADQINLMVHWIFDLKPGQTGAGLVRGLTGTVVAPTNNAIRELVLEASYTDAGRAPAGPLTGSSRLKLRSRRLEAEQADVISGPKRHDNDQAGGRAMLGNIDRTHMLRFNNLDLADTASVSCRVEIGKTNAVIEFRDGSPQGDLLATIEVKPASGGNQWVELNSPLRTTNHRTTVCLTFTSPSTNRLLNLDWVQFNPR